MSTTPIDLNPDEALKQAALGWRPGQPAIAPYQANPGLALPAVGPASMKQPEAPRGTVEGDTAHRTQVLSSKPWDQTIASNIENSQFGQNHPTAGKILGGVAQFGGALADTLIPRGLAARLPFTEQAHALETERAGKALTEDTANAEKQAQTANLNAQPEIKQAQLGLKEQQLGETTRQHDQQLREHGFKTDELGKIVPLPYEEMNPNQQAIHDLKGAQEEEAEATTALKKAQADPNSPQARMAQQRIDNAHATRQIALERLGLSERTFDARYHGTDEQGQALPGAMITDEGKPVGSSFSANVRPTGTERNKADMAGSAKEQLSDIADIVAKHPTLFGPGYGQTSAFRQWIGSQDPDAQRFVAARTIAGDHLAGTFGGRSEAALNALDTAIGQYKDNPAALKAGLAQLSKANERFLKAGTVRTAGSKANTAAETAPTFKVRLSDAMALPQNKGKSEADVRADVQKHGGEVVE
jgi:hypothetical protein